MLVVDILNPTPERSITMKKSTRKTGNSRLHVVGKERKALASQPLAMGTKGQYCYIAADTCAPTCTYRSGAHVRMIV